MLPTWLVFECFGRILVMDSCATSHGRLGIQRFSAFDLGKRFLEKSWEEVKLEHGRKFDADGDRHFYLHFR